MSNGKFINFYLPYMQAGKSVPEQQQAQQILTQAQNYINQGVPGVAITYSANYGQTRDIIATYAAGGWNTKTSGLNQAEVMHQMENMERDSPYISLQGKLHIAPLTTMNAYVNPVNPWNEKVQLNLVNTDLANIKNYLQRGWYVLGWQNQSTVNDPSHPYAIGGGVASIPAAVNQLIQQTLITYAKQFT